jgi:hypothetical protein
MTSDSNPDTGNIWLPSWLHSNQTHLTLHLLLSGLPRLYENDFPYDPTADLCLWPYDGLGGGEGVLMSEVPL